MPPFALNVDAKEVRAPIPAPRLPTRGGGTSERTAARKWESETPLALPVPVNATKSCELRTPNQYSTVRLHLFVQRGGVMRIPGRSQRALTHVFCPPPPYVCTKGGRERAPFYTPCLAHNGDTRAIDRAQTGTRGSSAPYSHIFSCASERGYKRGTQAGDTPKRGPPTPDLRAWATLEREGRPPLVVT